MIVKTSRTFVPSSRSHTTLPAQPSSAVWTTIACFLLAHWKRQNGNNADLCCHCDELAIMLQRHRAASAGIRPTVTLWHAAVQEGTMGAGLQVSPHWSTRGHMTGSSPLIGPGSRARPRRRTSGCRRRTCPSCGRGRSCAGRSTSPWTPSPGACPLLLLSTYALCIFAHYQQNYQKYL